VSILEGLEITARTAGNRVVHDAVMESRASIAGGATISEPLKASGVFPPMVVQMINVGEQTGGLDDMLAKIADFYDDEVDAAVSALTSVLEPIMIVVMGVVIGGMVVAMYLPMFDLNRVDVLLLDEAAEGQLARSHADVLLRVADRAGNVLRRDPLPVVREQEPEDVWLGAHAEASPKPEQQRRRAEQAKF
jgi:hypothetical protein